MADVSGKGRIRHASIDAVVTRADGTVVDLGRVDDSRWFRRDPRRWLARRRIEKFNKQRSE